MKVSAALLSLFCASVAVAAEDLESRLESPRALRSPDGWFRAQIPVKGARVIDIGDGYFAVIDIGSASPVFCTIYRKGFDMADALRKDYRTALAYASKAKGRIMAVGLEGADAGVFGDVPYIEARWQFGTTDGQQDLDLGGLKQLAFVKRGHGVSCIHQDQGYARTFDAVMRAFVETFDAPAIEDAPAFVEIMTISVQGTRIGIAVQTLHRTAKGGIRAVQKTAMIIPSYGELSSHDAVHKVQLRSDESLESASHLIKRDGSPVVDAELKLRGGRWVVKGRQEGGKLNTTLPAGAKPGNWIQQARELRKLLAAADSVGSEYTHPAWTSTQPGELLDMRTRVLARNGPDEFEAQISFPNFDANVVLDRVTGTNIRADIPRGEQTIHMERVYLSGSF